METTILPAKMTDEQLVERHEQVKFQLEELDAEAKIIREEFGDRLDKEHIDGKLVGDFNVTRKKMITFPDFPIEKAEELGAIKKAVDTTFLRKIHKTMPIKGAQEVSYVTISHVKPKEGEDE
jgi:hypothetical protein